MTPCYTCTKLPITSVHNGLTSPHSSLNGAETSCSEPSSPRQSAPDVNTLLMSHPPTDIVDLGQSLPDRWMSRCSLAQSRQLHVAEHSNEHRDNLDHLIMILLIWLSSTVFCPSEVLLV